MIFKIIVIVSIIFTYISNAQNYGSWAEIESLNEVHAKPSVVLMEDGNILITDDGANSTSSTSEIYNTQTGHWSITTNMNVRRVSHGLMKLGNGNIIAIGGFKQKSCEIFNPATGEWTMTDSLSIARSFPPSFTELMDGRILICGGMIREGDSLLSKYLNDCEIYDYRTGKWTDCAKLNTARYNHTATLLDDGRVLIAGGRNDSLYIVDCEIYDPQIDKFIVTNSLQEARNSAAAIKLTDGRIFVCGGRDFNGSYYYSNSCEIFNPQKEKWTYAGDMIDRRYSHYVFYLNQVDRLLILGGAVGQASLEDTWEIYNPNTLEPESKGIFPETKAFINPIQLSDGSIIVAGGYHVSYSSGSPFYFPTYTCHKFDIITSLSNSQAVPNEFTLFQNYPNPFNPSTIISYRIKETAFVQLSIVNILGETVKVLVNVVQSGGYHSLEFNSKNLPNGVYLYRLTVGNNSTTHKMLILK